MTTFNDREKGFENKYAHDQELAFKANARANKLLGLWAAEKLGKAGVEAEVYAKEVAIADLESAGDDDVVAKVEADFKKANIALGAHDIRVELERLRPVARAQIAGEKK